MAKNPDYRPVDSTTYELVGTGLNPDTSVAPPAAKKLPASAVAQQAQQPSIPQPQAVSGPAFEAVDTAEFDMSSSDLFDELPEYANGASPRTPINQSPLGITDRLKLSLGNKAGALNYLKQRYEDVKIDKVSGAFVVKDKGSWYRVDPNGLGDGDAWQRTKEILKDMADLGDIGLVTAGQAGGAAGAGLLGLPSGPGAVAVAAAGGAAGAGLAGALKSRLGRLAGTYVATPEEELKDAATEAMLGLGGEVIGLGAKVGLRNVKNAYKAFSETAANQSKEIMSAAMAQAHGYPRWTFRRAMDDPSIIDLADDVMKKAGRSADINKKMQLVNKMQSDVINDLTERAPNALKTEFNNGIKAIEAKLPADFSSNLGQAATDVGHELAAAGLLKAKQIGKRTVFSVYSPKELAEQFGTEVDQLPKLLSPEMIKSVNKVAQMINDYGKLPTVKGKMAARKLLEVKNAMNDVFGEMINYAPEGSRLKALGAEMKTKANEAIGQKFVDAGVGPDYMAMNKRYSELADSAKMLQQIRNTPTLQREGMVKALIKKLSDQTGSFKQLQGETKALSDLFKEDAVNPIQRLLDLEAAGTFLDVVPKNLGGNSLTTAIRGGAALAGGPRMSGKAIKAAGGAGKFADFAKNLGPKQAAQLVSDPNALREALRISFGQEAAEAFDENQDKQQ